MKNIINDIRRRTPSCPDGYYYVKTQKIYIPFSNLTIHCIEKDISQLDPFSLSVMRIVDEGITDLKTIKALLGISDSVFEEAVSDLAHSDCVFLTGGSVGLTVKGKTSLKENKRVARQNIDLRNVYVDLITGKMYDADIRCTIPKGRYIPLESIVEVNDKYFSEHFKDLKNIHRLRKSDYQINEHVPVTLELEKVTGYEDPITYVEKDLHIYKSISSSDLWYNFDEDPDDVYQNQFYKQIGRELISGNQRFFFETFNKERDFAPPFTPDPELLTQTEHIREIILSFASDEEKEDAYPQRHYALCDREYESYIANSDRLFKFDYILIMCSDISILLSDSFCSQLESISQNIPVLIVGDGSIKDDQVSADHFFPKNKRGGKLKLLSVPSLSDKLGKQGGYICFYPGLIVDITKHTAVTEFKNGSWLRRIAFSEQTYDFDKQTVDNAVNRMAEICPEIKKLHGGEFPE